MSFAVDALERAFEEAVQDLEVDLRSDVMLATAESQTCGLSLQTIRTVAG
jgi:nicotinamide mononucleotide (NMN) deamidase PncC